MASEPHRAPKRAKRGSGRASFESRLALAAGAAGGIPSVLLVIALWAQGTSPYLVTLIALALCALVAWSVHTVRTKTLYQFRSLGNLLQAMVAGDYSLRGRMTGKPGALRELIDAINDLSDALTRERLSATESRLLVDKIIDRIDVAIVAMDAEGNPTLANPPARRLLGFGSGRSGRSHDPRQAGVLAELAEVPVGSGSIRDLAFPGRKGRFHVHKERFREQGASHELIFITDVRTMLRAEERKAWRNLIRVIGHEINNSLAPISSISETLQRRVEGAVHPGLIDPDLADRVQRNLALMGERAASLADFTDRYRKLARVPEPRRVPTDLRALLDRSVSLVGKSAAGCPDISLVGEQTLTPHLDPGLMEQALINLLANACEAMEEREEGDSITVGWRKAGRQAVIEILDAGPGITNPDNLFVPFYSTKRGGSGIGLILSRQIIEAHGGYLTLANRDDRSGCRVEIELPID
jgi:nitrogen fixation/metabolism regulation signal transduction histidine kinase